MLPDTTNAKTGDYSAIKPDWYDVVFEDFQEKFDKNKNEYTELALRTDTDRPIWCNLSHQEDFLWKVKQFKVAIGMGDTETDLTPYKGTRLSAFIRNREVEKNGEKQNYPDVRKFRPFGDSQPQTTAKPDDDDLPF